MELNICDLTAAERCELLEALRRDMRQQDKLAKYGHQFEPLIAQFIDSSSPGFCEHMGIPALVVAKTLHAAIRGLKHSSTSREEFIEGVRTAVHVLLAPIARYKLHQSDSI